MTYDDQPSRLVQLFIGAGLMGPDDEYFSMRALAEQRPIFLQDAWKAAVQDIDNGYEPLMAPPEGDEEINFVPDIRDHEERKVRVEPVPPVSVIWSLAFVHSLEGVRRSRRAGTEHPETA
ncbi:MAG: hypothetical protein U5Q44_00405 [Dehalococcoidia bacterium]|nr:hypothetical protein [Dehalococcoidia bacterium]